VLSHYVSRGFTPQQIADRYDVTAVSVRSWLRKFGLSPNSTRKDVTARLHKLGYSSWDKFFRGNMTLTHMDAAKMLDCHWTSVAFYRRLWANGEEI